MSIAIGFPLVTALVALAASWFVPRFARPATAVWALTLAIVLAVLATLTLLLQLSAAGLSEVPVIADVIGWCRVLYGGQHGATPIVGVVSLLALGFIGWWIASHVRRVWSGMRQFSGVTGVEVVDLDRPLAFAVPGNPGGVVISRSMLDELDRDERSVILAHENAHLRYHHHVFVHVAGACSAGLPFLSPFARKVAYLTERWADEFAANRVGSRDLVATTIARVALLPNAIAPLHAQALVSGDVVGRFEALKSPPLVSTPRRTIAVGLLVAVALVATGFQVHHLVDFLSHSR